MKMNTTQITKNYSRNKKRHNQYLKLFILSLTNKDYGKINDIALIAKNEEQARQLASKFAGSPEWIEEKLSSCKELKLNSSPQIVLSEYWEEVDE